MQALFIVLNQTEYLEDILAVIIEQGFKGATLLESQGMGGAIKHGMGKVPFFGSLKLAFDGAHPYNKTIFTVIEDDQLCLQTIEAVKRVLADSRQPGAGFLFTMPVGIMDFLGQQ